MTIPVYARAEARVRAAQIVVRDLEKADEVKARLENGEDFAKVAARSIHRTGSGPRRRPGFDFPSDHAGTAGQNAF